LNHRWCLLQAAALDLSKVLNSIHIVYILLHAYVCVAHRWCLLQAAALDLSKVLLPAAVLRPGAAQRCVQKQDHGLDSGLDVHLIPHCRAALPEGRNGEAEPVYIEMEVQNTHR
jgi:hypothetical protein